MHNFITVHILFLFLFANQSYIRHLISLLYLGFAIWVSDTVLMSFNNPDCGWTHTVVGEDKVRRGVDVSCWQRPPGGLHVSVPALFKSNMASSHHMHTHTCTHTHTLFWHCRSTLYTAAKGQFTQHALKSAVGQQFIYSLRICGIQQQLMLNQL